jgi:hypothetical protein
MNFASGNQITRPTGMTTANAVRVLGRGMPWCSHATSARRRSGSR